MYTTVGERIKIRRKELNMTQSELAEKLGYTDKAAICRIEKGANNLKQSKIVAFSKALECSPSYIMGWEDEDEYEQGYQAAEYSDLISKINRLSPEGQAKVFEYIEFICLKENIR